MKLTSAIKLSLISIILLILPVICSGMELVDLYDGWAPYGKNFTAGGYTFMIGGKSNMESFVVNLPTGGIISISEADCYTKDYFMVCYNGSRRFDWLNVTLDKEYWNALINISKYEEEAARRLEITKSYDYEVPVLIQEPISIKIKLYNNATTAAKSILLKDSFPSELHVTEITGCEYFGTNIRWTGDLHTRKTHLCTYTLKATTNTSYSTAAEAEYIMDDIEYTARSEKEQIDISIPLLEASSYITNNTLNVGDIVFYSINMTNVDDDEEMRINKLDIIVPKHIKILKSGPRFKEAKYGLTFRDTLDKNEGLDVWLLGGVILPGNATIATTIDYTIRGVFTHIELEENISIDTNGEVEVNVSFDNITNISDIINISGIDILENVSLDANISGIDNISEQENVSAITGAVIEPIITKAIPEKEPMPYIVIIGIILIVLIIVGVIIVIKKRRSAF